jgi:hypothetical protein
MDRKSGHCLWVEHNITKRFRSQNLTVVSCLQDNRFSQTCNASQAIQVFTPKRNINRWISSTCIATSTWNATVPPIPRHNPVSRGVASDWPGPVWPEAALASSKPRLLVDKVHQERSLRRVVGSHNQIFVVGCNRRWRPSTRYVTLSSESLRWWAWLVVVVEVGLDCQWALEVVWGLAKTY